MTEGDPTTVADVEYDPTTHSYHTQFSLGQSTPTTAVVSALASVRRCDPTDLDPLYESVDTDAMNNLLKHTGEAHVTLAFEVDSFTVSVSNAGQIEIEPPESEPM